MGLYATRAQRRQMAAENARQPRMLREIPRAEWPASATNQLRVLRSRDFLVQEYPATAPAIVRLSISRTTLSGGEWVDGSPGTNCVPQTRVRLRRRRCDRDLAGKNQPTEAGDSIQGEKK